MQDDVREKEDIKSEYLEVLLRIVRERVIRQCELSRSDIKGLEYWVDSGMVIKNSEGRNPEEPIEKEVHYLITDEGEEYSLKCKFNFKGFI
jgi:hypothetical protein